jgi:hypothetical protein
VQKWTRRQKMKYEIHSDGTMTLDTGQPKMLWQSLKRLLKESEKG